MPVPVAVTHTKGVGLEAASTTELATAGPFARAAAARDSAGDAPPAEIPLSPASEAAAPPQTSATQDRAASDLPAIGTNGLDFSYPGIGMSNHQQHLGDGTTMQTALSSFPVPHPRPHCLATLHSRWYRTAALQLHHRILVLSEPISMPCRWAPATRHRPSGP